MPFDLKIWQEKVKSQLQNWHKKMQLAGLKSNYAWIATATLWPVLAEVSAGNIAALAPYFALMGNVGSNFLANQLQSWTDKSEAEVAANLAILASQNETVREELDLLIEKFDSLTLARQQLPPAALENFLTTLATELKQLGNLPRFEAVIQGTGIIAQGAGAKAVGPDSNLFENSNGNFVGNTIILQTNVDADKPKGLPPRQIYLERLSRYCLTLPLAPLGGDEGTDEEVTLDQVYIDLNTTTQLEGRKTGKADRSQLEAEQIEAYKNADVQKFNEITQQLKQVDAPDFLPARDALIQSHKMVLLGDPGAGKSTFVRRILACYAEYHLHGKDLPTGLEPELFPVIVILRELVPRLGKLDLSHLSGEKQRELLAKTVCDQIFEDLATRFEAAQFADELRQIFSSGKCLLVLDGLDEVPYPYRHLIRRSVAALLQSYRLQRIVVTCRIRSYTGEAVLPNFNSFTLAPFHSQQIKAFVTAWYQTLKKLNRIDAGKMQSKTEDLQRAALSKDLRELAENPMLLTTMALIHQREIGLPKQRVCLYTLAVDVMLRRWQKFKTDEQQLVRTPALAEFLGDNLKLRNALEHLAYEAHTAGSGQNQVADIPRGKALTLLEGPAYLGSTALAAEFLDYVDQRAGLLLGKGGQDQQPTVYNFPHRTFQEYLAGCYLLKQRDLERRLITLAGTKDDWAQVITLVFEELRFNRNFSQQLYDLAYRLWTPTASEKAARQRLWSAKITELVGVAEIEQDQGFDDGGKNYLTRLTPGLKNLLTSELNPIERAEAGRLLNLIGDPRREVTTLEEMEFCLVAGGPFQMGTVEDDDLAYKDEQPQHLNKMLKQDYWISRFPVTHAQYQLFVADGGYRNAAFWKEAIDATFWNETGFQGRWDSRHRQEPVNWGAPFNLPNHPVVGVSWYEALAFVRWLDAFWRASGQNGQLQLPSETEWEKAARGGLKILVPAIVRKMTEIQPKGSLKLTDNPIEQGRYPWGEEIDPNRSNYEKTGIGATSAVGCFPGGASPCGCEEMSGNVWEWTRSLYGKDWDKPEFGYPYQLETDRERLDASSEVPRVLRGGAYLRYPQYVRCAYRSRSYPHDRDDSVGFRVVFLPYR